VSGRGRDPAAADKRLRIGTTTPANWGNVPLHRRPGVEGGWLSSGDHSLPKPRAGLGQRVPPPVLVLGGVVSAQLGAAFAKGLVVELGAAGTVLLRVAAAAVLLGTLFGRQQLRLSRRHLGWVVAFGAVLALMNLSFYAALGRIPLAAAVTIDFIGPLAVAVGGSRRLVDLLWVALAAAGVLLLTGGFGGGLDPIGVLLAFAAAACWAGYILLSQRVGRAVPGGAGLIVAMAVAAVLLVPVGVAGAGARLLEPGTVLLAAAVGLLSSAIPYALELEALRRLSARAFGILMSLEPAVGAVAGLIVLREALRPRELAGIALVIGASAGVTRTSSQTGDGD
jgi:inner membrane transporter RhtA